MDDYRLRSDRGQWRDRYDDRSGKELAYVNGTVWQENSANLWWGKTTPGAPWSPGAGTAASPLPPTSSKITLNVSEDAWQGDAQFTVAVDGTKVGGTLTATTLHSSGDVGCVYADGRLVSRNARGPDPVH